MKSDSIKYVIITAAVAIIIFIIWYMPSCDEIKFRRENPMAYHQYESVVNDYEAQEAYECESCGKNCLSSLLIYVDGSSYCPDCISDSSLFEIRHISNPNK